MFFTALMSSVHSFTKKYMTLLHCFLCLLYPLKNNDAFHSECMFMCFQTRTLFYLDVLVKELASISLTPLTLPLLHLAEVIANDLSFKSHSDLYRLRYAALTALQSVYTSLCSPLYVFFLVALLMCNYRSCFSLFVFRIVKTCYELGLDSPYKEAVHCFVHIPEDEQML